MKRYGKTIWLLAVPLVAVALAGACGGDDDSDSTSETLPATEWAGDVCSAVQTWTDSLQSAVTPLQSGDVSKDSIQGAADDVKSATSTFVDDVKGLGPPDTENGDKAKQTVDTLADDLNEGADSISSEVDGISEASAAMAALPKISTTLATMGSQAKSALSELEQLDAQGELKTGFEDADSCKTLRGSS